MQSVQGLIFLIAMLIITAVSGIVAYKQRGPWNGFGFVLICLFGITSITLVRLFG
jgi:hypothetical protein